MPDYELELGEQRDGPMLTMRRRQDGEGGRVAPPPAADLPLLAERPARR